MKTIYQNLNLKFPKTLLYYSLAILLVFVTGCNNESSKKVNDKIQYTCPMDPQVVQDKPGDCPVCGMHLVKAKPRPKAKIESIILNENQIHLANITTVPVKDGQYDQNIHLTGKLTFNNDQTQIVAARISGRIEKLYFKQNGERIKRGQPLYEIYSEELQIMKQEYILALRRTELKNDEASQAFLAAAGNKLLLIGLSANEIISLGHLKNISPITSFSAPFSGLISKIEISEGQYITAGFALYKIENDEKLWVEAQLYPGEELGIKSGDEALVSISGHEVVNARVVFINPEYNNSTQIISLRILIDNHDHKFFPGAQAEVTLSNTNTQASIWVPADAVIHSKQDAQVWIKKNDSFERRFVKIGDETFDKVEIIDGLHTGESVVVSGAYLLYSELSLTE